MSGFSTGQNILCARYFWPFMFKYWIIRVQKCHNCHIYYWNMCAPVVPLHPIIVVGPFTKWVIDFLACNPHSVRGNGYIILVVDYLMKWVEEIPTYKHNGETYTIFIFNHVISRFWVPQAIITNHGSHFWNFMMTKLTVNLGLHYDNSTMYYQ